MSTPAPASTQTRSRFAPRSLRGRLLAGLLLLVTLGILAVDVAGVAALRSYLLGRVDEQLRAAAGPVVSRLTGSDDVLPPTVSRQVQIAPTDYVIELVDDTGTLTGLIVDQAGQGQDTLPVLTGLDRRTVTDRAGRPFTVSSTDANLDYRVIAVPLGRFRGSVVIAIPLTELASTTRQLLVIEAIASIVVIAAMGLVALAVVRVGLRPLRDVEGTARAIADGDLSRRVTPAEPGTEVGRLGLALNDMLGQIEGAFAERRASEDRLRQFVADASHELRTPLTSIRGYAELHRQGAVTDPEHLTRVMGRIEHEATRMGSLVEELLLLARLDERRVIARDPVVLSVLVADAVSDLRARQPGRPVTVELPPEDVTVQGDRHQLEQVLANLLGNVAVHVPETVPVRVTLGTAGEQAVLTVADDGAGMAPEVSARIFERFYRADTARTRARGGTGLGLAIVAAVVSAHGGRVAVDSNPGMGTTFTVVVPLLAPVPHR